MNPVAMTINNPKKEYCPTSQGLNQQPPVLKSCMLPTDLGVSAEQQHGWLVVLGFNATFNRSYNGGQ